MEVRNVGVLAGDRVKSAWLGSWLAESKQILAADGGADLVLDCGFRPDYLIGDLDSVSEVGRENAWTIVEVLDQNFTDCQKLLNHASMLGLRELVLCGGEGTRFDHMIHVFHCVLQWKGNCVVAYEKMLGCTLVGPGSVTVPAAGIVSAIPLEPCSGVSMGGVRWPLDRVEMSPRGYSSISNHGLGEATVSLEEGALAVLWEYDGKPAWDMIKRG